jgi:hypothetical protein
MSYKKLFWGILLVIIGSLFILKNLGWIYFDWWTVLRLWPLVLILWGISIIPVQGFIKVILSFVAIALAFVLVSKFDNRERPHFNWDNRHHNWSHNFDYSDDDTTYSDDVQELFQSYDSSITSASLRFQAAAGDFRLSDSLLSDKLLLFRKKGNLGNYSMESNDDGGNRNIELSIEESHVKLNNKGNLVQLYLNPEPTWDFKFDIGAANINFDLSKFKTGKVEVDGGASSINLRLGSLAELSRVNINAGAASISINVPKDAGVEVETETVLTSRNFIGFNKLSKGHYRTDNFDAATSKIYIEVDAGVSSLNVNRY